MVVPLVFGCALAGCGRGGSETELTVSAASSLTEVMRALGEETAAVERFSFGGSDQLAAQIRQGAAPDVFASASFDYPRQLFEAGLVGRPVRLASNSLVVAVRADSPIGRVEDLVDPEVDLVIGSEGVPAGDYAREAISRLDGETAAAILANVRSSESDVKAVVGKVAQGAADAGFVYASDVAANPELRAVGLPKEIRPEIAYAIAPVTSSNDPEAAARFIAELRSPAGRAALEASGFKVAD